MERLTDGELVVEALDIWRRMIVKSCRQTWMMFAMSFCLRYFNGIG